MNTQTDIERPAATLPGASPVAIQRGRHDDRMVLARLRAARRWLVRDRDKAGLVPDPPPPRRGPARPGSLVPDSALLLLRLVVGITFLLHGIQKLDDLSGTERFFAFLGIPAPELMSPLVAVTETAGGLLLIAGLATPLVL